MGEEQNINKAQHKEENERYEYYQVHCRRLQSI